MRGVVTLCGSTRFRPLFELAAAELTVADWAVLGVGVFDRARSHNEADPPQAALKRALDRLHFDKIDMSWAVVVLNGTLENQRHPETGLGGTWPGYIGVSTRREVAHAREGLKPVFWYDLKAAMRALAERDGGYGGSAKPEPWDWTGGDRSWLDLLPRDHPLRGADNAARNRDAQAFLAAPPGDQAPLDA